MNQFVANYRHAIEFFLPFMQLCHENVLLLVIQVQFVSFLPLRNSVSHVLSLLHSQHDNKYHCQHLSAIIKQLYANWRTLVTVT